MTPRPREPWFESPRVEEEIAARGLPADVADAARSLHSCGFAAFRAIVPDDLRRRVVEDMTRPLRDVDRVLDAWTWKASVRELALLPPVMERLRALYGREPVPFQTLNFQYGTEQRGHCDIVHFNSIPTRFMCGVWVALEDTDAGNGPVFYYPRSHLLPEPNLQRFGLPAGVDGYPDYERAQHALVEAHGLEPVEFHARAGDVLVWSANLVHGGSPITEPGRTRWSQVTHYFFEDCIYVTPLLSDPELGEWFVREGLVDISTGEPAPQSLDGEPVHFRPLGNGRQRIHRGEMGAPAGAEVVAQLQHELDTLRRSPSYRLGARLLGPATWMRRQLRRWTQRATRRG